MEETWQPWMKAHLMLDLTKISNPELEAKGKVIIGIKMRLALSNVSEDVIKVCCLGSYLIIE